MNAAYVKGWFRVGTALLRMGRFQEATAAFDKALALDPDNHEIEARLNEARAAVHAAEMVRPCWTNSQIIISPSLLRIDSSRRPLGVRSQSLCHSPSRAGSQNEKDERARAALVTGLALLAGGLLDESLKVLEAALDIDSRDQSVKEQLWLAVGDAEAAVSARAKVGCMSATIVPLSRPLNRRHRDASRR